MTTDSLGNVFVSTDNMYDYPDVVKLPLGKKEWVDIEKGLPLDMLTNIITDNKGNLYITRFDDGGGLYKSTDTGNNWKLVENEFNNAIILNIASDSKGNIVGEFENLGVYRSTDGGENWSTLSKNDYLKNYIRTYGIMFDPQDNLYINYFPNGIFRSRDYGNTWEFLGDSFLDGDIWKFSIDRDGFIWIFTSKNELYHSSISIFNY
jgi:ligand-binding sensor domain-containing protein